MTALPVPGGVTPPASCSTSRLGPVPGRLAVPDAVVVVVVVLVLAVLAASGREVPAALVLLAGAVGDLVRGHLATGRNRGRGGDQR